MMHNRRGSRHKRRVTPYDTHANVFFFTKKNVAYHAKQDLFHCIYKKCRTFIRPATANQSGLGSEAQKTKKMQLNKSKEGHHCTKERGAPRTQLSY
jgi:hypothetical protein